MRFFSSNVKNRIDGKGRVSIPAPFRKVLEQEATPGVVLIPGMGGHACIDGMGHSRLEQMAESLDGEPLDPVAYALQVSLIGEARQLQLDDTGRIVLPQDLREMAGLEGETALFVGLGKTFQIWNPEAYEAQRAELKKIALANFDRLKLRPAGGAG
jgi:MraZ protein